MLVHFCFSMWHAKLFLEYTAFFTTSPIRLPMLRGCAWEEELTRMKNYLLSGASITSSGHHASSCFMPPRYLWSFDPIVTIKQKAANSLTGMFNFNEV